MRDREEILSVLRGNLTVFRKRQEDAKELRRITVQQLIELLCTEAGAEAEACYSLFEGALPDASGEERLLLCQALSEKDGSNQEKSPLTKLLRVSCMENPASRAILAQANRLGLQIEISSISGFAQACEEVLDGNSHACLLPLFSTADGKLYRFYDMMERYDLNILMACDMDTEDGEQSVRYALAGHPSALRLSEYALPHLLDFSVTDSGCGCAEEIPLTAKACGAELLQIDSLPLPFDTGLRRFYFTLQMPLSMIPTFQLYLSLRYPGYARIGSYPLLPRISL